MIYIFLMITDVEHLVMDIVFGLFLEKCLFEYFVHLLNWVICFFALELAVGVSLTDFSSLHAPV